MQNLCEGICLFKEITTFSISWKLFKSAIFYHIEIGYKSTINRNNFNTAKCKSERYQGLDFTTVGNSDCVFQKSKCVQEGQIVYKVNKDSSLEDDTKCMCDYTKGYLFITLPTSRCFCTPTVEDCSCFREFCSTGNLHFWGIENNYVVSLSYYLLKRVRLTIKFNF